MTEDKSLLWARERCAQWYEAVDNHTVAAMFRAGERDYFQPLQARAEAFRAGQAEADARVKALETALKEMLLLADLDDWEGMNETRAIVVHSARTALKEMNNGTA